MVYVRCIFFLKLKVKKMKVNTNKLVRCQVVCYPRLHLGEPLEKDGRVLKLLTNFKLTEIRLESFVRTFT